MLCGERGICRQARLVRNEVSPRVTGDHATALINCSKFQFKIKIKIDSKTENKSKLIKTSKTKSFFGGPWTAPVPDSWSTQGHCADFAERGVVCCRATDVINANAETAPDQ